MASPDGMRCGNHQTTGKSAKVASTGDSSGPISMRHGRSHSATAKQVMANTRFTNVMPMGQEYPKKAAQALDKHQAKQDAHQAGHRSELPSTQDAVDPASPVHSHRPLGGSRAAAQGG